MQRLFITGENLKVLLKDLKKKHDEFIAPKKEFLGDIIFSDTKGDNNELLDYEGNSVISPRAFLLPQTETLFKIKSAKNFSFVQLDDKKKRIFYGLRPCDIKALVLMREFFLSPPVDYFYQKKLERSFFICLACNKRCSEKSFCNEIDSGPQAKEGFDLQLISLSKGYLVEIGSKKASLIIKKHKKLFISARPQHLQEKKILLMNFSSLTKRIDYKKVAQRIRDGKVNKSVWDDIALRCVVCSGCITLCPTCSCFSIMDRLDGDMGERIRFCDGCVYAGFTRMSGGIMPEPMHKQHIRRFFEHKFSIDVGRLGRPSCVGCARCIQACPGNISVRKFIEEVVNGS